MLNILSSDDVLVGHDIINDLNVLKIQHDRCIDTSKIFPHANNGINAPSLKFLASKYLNRQIQNVRQNNQVYKF